MGAPMEGERPREPCLWGSWQWQCVHFVAILFTNFVEVLVVHFVASFVADNGQGDRIDKACDKAPDKD